MKIIIVKSPPAVESSWLSGYFNDFSLSLGYIAGSLREDGHEVEILNASLMKLSIEQTVEKIVKDKYGLIGFSIPYLSLVTPTIKIVQILRSLNISNHITIGGHAATFSCNEILSMCPEIDSVVLYEGEQTIRHLAAAIEKKLEWRNVPGIVYWNAKRIKKNEFGEFFKYLDNIPFPARDDLEYIVEKGALSDSIPIISSRGCLYNCGFCSVSSFYKSNGNPTWRRRSIENIIEETKILISKYGVNDFVFVDDLFVSRSNEDTRYIEDFAQAIIDNNIKCMFSISSSVDSIDEYTLGLLKGSGLVKVLIGAESANQEILDFFNKKITPKDIARAISVINDFNIEHWVSFINFTPLTTITRLKENISFFMDLGVNIIYGLLNRYQVYPGTPLFDYLGRKNQIVGNFPHYGYVEGDDKVELIYDICKSSMRTFVAISYDLKEVSKVFRKFQFEMAEKGDIYNDWRDYYALLLEKISAEAVELFYEVIKFVEYRDISVVQKGVEAFKREIATSAAELYSEWNNMLRYFKEFFLDISNDKEEFHEFAIRSIK